MGLTFIPGPKNRDRVLRGGGNDESMLNFKGFGGSGRAIGRLILSHGPDRRGRIQLRIYIMYVCMYVYVFTRPEMESHCPQATSQK